MQLVATALIGGAAVAGLTAGVNVWMVQQVSPLLYDSADVVPERPVAIVLGARPSDALADRLQAALTLYRAGRVEKILASGDGRHAEVDQKEAMRRWLVGHGVPPQDLLLDADGLRTLTTMSRAREHFDVDAAIICTQSFHLARSVWLARRFGIDAVGLAADREDYSTPWIDAGRESLARVKAWGEVGWR